MNRQHDETQQVDLGFAQVELPPGTHICQIYDDESARTDAFVAFLRKGMELKELSAGFSDEISREGLLRELEDEAFEEAIRLQRTSDAYFTNNTFDPDGMIERLTSFHEASQEQPYTGGRVVGEMSPAIKRMEGSERLLEYEAKVNLLLRD